MKLFGIIQDQKNSVLAVTVFEVAAEMRNPETLTCND